MNIKVTKDNVCIINKEYIHEGEYKITKLEEAMFWLTYAIDLQSEE